MSTTAGFRNYKDNRARARISIRLQRLSSGNPGVVEPVGEGVSELGINHGPRYRIYYKRREDDLVVILAGGDKSRQPRDIKRATELARNL